MESIAIIIPTFNRKDLLKILLQAISEQENINFDLKIFVVVDGSTDGTFEMLKNEFSDVKIVMGNGNWWWTKSINEGVKCALDLNFKMFLLMNDDTYIDKSFLKNYVDQYLKNGCGVLAPISITDSIPYKIFYSGIKSVNWNIAKWKKYHPFFYPYSKDIKGIHPTQAVPGRGMLFNKEVIDSIGLFHDNPFPQYIADFDFGYRAMLAGYPTQVSWDCPIYAKVESTGKGSKINSGFLKYLASFFNPMASQSITKTFILYKRYAGTYYFFGFTLHMLRLIAVYLKQKLKKDI